MHDIGVVGLGRQRFAGGHVTHSASAGEGHRSHAQRTYRIFFALSVTLAVLGAPLFMHGAVALVQSLVGGAAGGPSSLRDGALQFVVSSLPLVVAGYTWHRTQELQSIIDE